MSDIPATAHHDCLVCQIAMADVQYLDDGNASNTAESGEFLSCMTESNGEPDGLANQVYRLDDLPRSFMERYKKELSKGTARIVYRKPKPTEIITRWIFQIM